jgi:ABC-type transporter MlaC component
MILTIRVCLLILSG